MARIKNPNGSSIQKEKKSSPDLPEDRRPVPLPRSVSMRPLSGAEKNRLGVQRQRSGVHLRCPKLVEVRFDEDNTTKK